MREYKPRIVDEILKDKLEAKGAVVIEGPLPDKVLSIWSLGLHSP